MLILRALLLSFPLTLRIIPYIPVFVLITFAFYTVAAPVIAVSMFISPFLSIFVALGVISGASVIPIMMGTRIALGSRDVEPLRPWYALLFPVALYGVFEAMVIVILLAGATAAFMFATSTTLSELGNLLFYINRDPEVLGLTDTHFMILQGLVIAVAVLICLLRAALLVPHAAASVARDPDGGYYTPFRGIGAGFFPLVALVVIGYAGSVGFVFGMGFLAQNFGYEAVYAEVLMRLSELSALNFANIDSFGWIDGVIAACLVVLFIWSYSVQCAGAALLYLSRQDGCARDKAQKIEHARLDPEDARALWKSRMPAHMQ